MDIIHNQDDHTYHIIPEKYATFNPRIFIERVITHSNLMGLRGQSLTSISSLKGTSGGYCLEYEEVKKEDVTNITTLPTSPN